MGTGAIAMAGLSDAEVGIGGGAGTLSDADVGIRPAAHAPTEKPDRSALDAYGRGAAQGLTGGFFDELHGLAVAGGADPKGPLGLKNILYGAYKRIQGDPEAQRQYEEMAAQERKATEQAREQHPYAAIAGDVTGALALPIGAAASGATMAARMGRGALTGAGYGALYGAGEGVGLQDRATKAAIGAGTGLVAGAVAPPVIAAAEHGINAIGRPFFGNIRAAYNPEAEASRRVASAIERDINAGSAELTAPEFMAARAAGAPVAISDLGGETTRALARSAANTSQEGRDALNRLANNRFEGQAQRAADFLQRLVGGNTDLTAARDTLRSQAQQINRPAYRAAYNAGDRPIWSDELERLSGSPAVEDAMKGAIERGKNRAIADGMGAFRTGATVTPDGRIVFNKGPSGVPTYPNLQFWDYTQRELRDAASAATRAGRNEEAGALNALHRQLRDALDAQVPEFASARAGAARFFNAEDALTAGENFVTQRMAITDARRALAQMSPQERDLFRQGFAAKLIDNITSTRDRQNVLNKLAQSPQDREKMRLALGDQGYRQTEAFLRVEHAMDRLRPAIQGNSTTARQWIERGMAGGASGIAGIGTYNLDPKEITAAAVVGALTAGSRHIDHRLARRVAEMLTSNDPQVLARGVRLITGNQNVRNAFANMERRLSRLGGMEGQRIPALQSLGIGHGEENQDNVPRPLGQ